MKRRYLFLLFAILLIALYLPGYSRLQYLATANRELEERIGQLEQENRALEAERDRLRGDLGYIEKIAREKLGVVKEGEVIYKVTPKKDPATP